MLTRFREDAYVWRPAKILRKERKVTQADIARLLGITQQAVGKWEAGKSTPDPTDLLRIAEYFDTSVDMLLGRDTLPVTLVTPYNPAAEVMVPVVGTRCGAGYGAWLTRRRRAWSLPMSATRRTTSSWWSTEIPWSRASKWRFGPGAPPAALDDGDLGVVVFGDEGEGTLKRFLRKGKRCNTAAL